jgi:hypothetical protein
MSGKSEKLKSAGSFRSPGLRCYATARRPDEQGLLAPGPIQDRKKIINRMGIGSRVEVDRPWLREELDPKFVRVVATRALDERRKPLHARSKSDRNCQKRASTWTGL